MKSDNDLARSQYFSTHFKHFQQIIVTQEDINYYKNIYGTYLPNNKDARILEIGSGLGKFLCTLKSLGYTNIQGADVSLEMVEIAKKNSGVNVIHVTDVSEFLSTQKNSYEYIFMLDVIEHIEKRNVIGLLNKINDSLVNNGVLILSTENMASPIGRIQYYLDFTHEYNYSEITLRQVLEICRFKMIKIWGIDDKISFHPKSAIIWVLKKMWFMLLRLLFVVERRGCTNPQIFTKELYAIAYKINNIIE